METNHKLTTFFILACSKKLKHEASTNSKNQNELLQKHDQITVELDQSIMQSSQNVFVSKQMESAEKSHQRKPNKNMRFKSYCSPKTTPSVFFRL